MTAVISFRCPACEHVADFPRSEVLDGHVVACPVWRCGGAMRRVWHVPFVHIKHAE